MHGSLFRTRSFFIWLGKTNFLKKYEVFEAVGMLQKVVVSRCVLCSVLAE
jgi:hypothetical protein